MKTAITLILMVSFTFTLTGSTWAVTDSSRPSSTYQTTKSGSLREFNQFHLREKIASQSAKIKERLAGAKLRACEKVEKSLTTRSNKMSESMIRHLGVLEKAQTRIEALASKRVTSGKTIIGYSGLLALANDARAKALGAIAEVKDPPAIDCSSDNPKAAVTEFKSSFKSAREALQNYHRALRNLLVAVASVTGQENRTSTSSAKPTTSSSTTR